MNLGVNIMFTFAMGLATNGWPLTLSAQTPFPFKPVRLSNPTTAGGQPDAYRTKASLTVGQTRCGR